MENEEIKIEEIIPEHEEEIKEEEEVQDDVYRLQEMADEMNKSIYNVKKIIEEQELLIKVLKKTKNGKLERFIKDSEEQVKHLNNQVMIMEKRHLFVDSVCVKCNEDEEIRKIVNQLLAGLGVFQQ